MDSLVWHVDKSKHMSLCYLYMLQHACVDVDTETYIDSDAAY